ncbi:MAG: hypothetical protein Hyperionvirus11_49 [Hyperionvirus sp.]|uniref:Sel1 repeat family protein n=1 Tax=Hyperionvirus sp. TaxID=2487770 RepID=A0A3G5A921_9VIRU|nr:MAG: hypothetical protein Hyperionvirus11_49 [Hyperionvirus sp.]
MSDGVRMDFKKALGGHLQENYKIRDYYWRGRYLREIYEFAKENAGVNDFAKYHYAKFFEKKNEFCEGDRIRGRRMMDEIAGRGNSFGQFALGVYAAGEKEVVGEKVVGYFNLSAVQDNRLSQYKLARIYLEGVIEKKNERAAYYWALAAAVNGESGAKEYVNDIYFDNVRGNSDFDDIKIDYHRLLQWSIELAGEGDEDKLDLLMLHLELNNPDHIEEIYNCFQLAREKNKKACYYLACVYLSDEYGKKSYEGAIEMVESLKKENDVDSLLGLGEMYCKSKDVKVLEIVVNGLEHCVKSDPDRAPVVNCLGLIFDGDNGLRDNGAAFYWFQKGALLGHGVDLYNVGLYFEDGVVVEKNLEIAFEYFKKGSVGGYEGAIKKVARMYKLGVGVGVNLVESFNHWASPLLGVDEESQINLAKMYSFGEGCEKDIRRGVEILSKLDLGSWAVAEAIREIGEKEGAAVMSDYVRYLRKKLIY